MIFYIHINPQKHGFVKDFREYPHTSYWNHLHQKATKLKRNEVLNTFKNYDMYIKFHEEINRKINLNDLILEFD